MIQPFHFNESSPSASTNIKKQVIGFRINGQSGDFNHLINKRRIRVGNESMVSFETGLRDYSLIKSKNGSNKGIPKEKFDSIPIVDRKEFPQFVMTKKDFEKKQKLFPNMKEGLYKEIVGSTGRQEIVYSAQ